MKYVSWHGPWRMVLRTHRQGFESLADIERAVLEPGGTLSFIARQPPPEETRHREILDRLERLAQELGQLRAKPSASEL